MMHPSVFVGAIIAATLLLIWGSAAILQNYGEYWWAVPLALTLGLLEIGVIIVCALRDLG